MVEKPCNPVGPCRSLLHCWSLNFIQFLVKVRRSTHIKKKQTRQRIQCQFLSDSVTKCWVIKSVKHQTRIGLSDEFRTFKKLCCHHRLLLKTIKKTTLFTQLKLRQKCLLSQSTDQAHIWAHYNPTQTHFKSIESSFFFSKIRLKT